MYNDNINSDTMIQFYNQYSKKIEPFTTVMPGKVKMYVCGVTPYDTSHLGHAFVFIVYDALRRFLQYQGYEVTYVQNVTDIDDPLFERAKRDNIGWKELGDKWTSYLLEDFKFLNIEMPTYYVKVTQELDCITQIVQGLLEKGYAYKSGGNVYYDISKFKEYGKLCNLSRDEMIKISSERGNDIHDKNKKDPLDFILWQTSKSGEPVWDSPMGKGRPGWHIECTAMSIKYLGQQIDIHGGGSDLIFPHHESEIAQAQAYTGKHPYVKFWMEASMVYQDQEKMSKSLGNLTYVRDLQKKYTANAIRYYLLSHNYRIEWEYNEEEMAEKAKEMGQIEEIIKDIKINKDVKTPEEFIQALSNDLDIPTALKIMLTEKDPGKVYSMFSLLGFKK